MDGVCDEGYAIRQVNDDGSVLCQLIDGTAYSAGEGLLLDVSVFSADPTYLQRRVTDACPAGESIRRINEDGSVVCELDDGSSYTAGFRMLLSDPEFSVDPAVIQERVNGSCEAGFAIRAINEDGTVSCEQAGGNTYVAGNQLELSGSTFNVLEGPASGLDADLLDG